VEQAMTNWADVSGHGHGTYFAEIHLDPELHASFCRRGRRRLKEIQMSSRAQLKFYRARGVLRVGGSEAQVAEVKRQLECLGGPRKSIRNAAWSELMRTRMSDDANSSVCQRIQQLSNCRVHIERTSKEVRLFGPKDAVAVASHLLDELQQLCIETLVEFDVGVNLVGEKIQQIAQQQCVTIVFEEGDQNTPSRANVCGFEFAVAAALKALETYEANPKMEIQEGLSEPVLASLAATLAKLSVGDESGTSTTGSMTKGPEDPEDCSSEGADNCPLGESGASPAQSAPNQYNAPCCSCPTCGATNFCVSCGSANEQFQMYAMNQMKVVPMGNGQMIMGGMASQMMPNMGPMGMQMPGQVFGNVMQVCMPMQQMQQMQQMPMAMSPNAEVNGSNDGQVFLVPAMMQPMMCDGSQKSFCM